MTRYDWYINKQEFKTRAKLAAIRGAAFGVAWWACYALIRGLL